MLTKPTFKALVRRSCRIAKTDDCGIYELMIDVRGKVLNPSTGRLVYIDGRTARMMAPQPPTSPVPTDRNRELLYFEEMKQRMMDQEKKPVIPVRRSHRLEERKHKAEIVDEGMDVTLRLIKPKRRQKCHMGDTIQMLTETFVRTNLFPTIKIDRLFNL